MTVVMLWNISGLAVQQASSQTGYYESGLEDEQNRKLAGWNSHRYVSGLLQTVSENILQKSEALGNRRISFTKECGHLFAVEQVMNKYVAALVAVLMTNSFAQVNSAPAPVMHPAPAGKPGGPAKVGYSLTTTSGLFSTLHGTFNGKTFVLISKKREMCLKILAKKDFDGDGLPDALVENIAACGGNCCSNTFFFVSPRPDGHFVVSPEFADSWDTPVIKRWKGRWSVVVISNNTGRNTDPPVEFTRRFVLEAGRPVKVGQRRRKDMKSIVELRSNMFDSEDPEAPLTLEYDLDGDGKKDTITGKFGERWGSMVWTVEFANGKTFDSHVGCRRVGVLATKSNGVNDIVCDQDWVFRWDGTKYIEPAD